MPISLSYYSTQSSLASMFYQNFYLEELQIQSNLKRKRFSFLSQRKSWRFRGSAVFVNHFSPACNWLTDQSLIVLWFWSQTNPVLCPMLSHYSSKLECWLQLCYEWNALTQPQHIFLNIVSYAYHSKKPSRNPRLFYQNVPNLKMHSIFIVWHSHRE